VTSSQRQGVRGRETGWRRRYLGVALGSVGLVVVAGCAAAPERHEPDFDFEPPARWTAAAAAVDSLGAAPADSAPAWWADFQDATLESLVAEALSHNHDLRAAVVRVDAAIALGRLAGADRLPQLSAGFRGSRDRRNFIGTPIPTASITTYGVSLDASWEIDLWGRIRSAQSAALAEAQAAWADVHAARLSLAAQTAKAYFAVTEARRQVDLADEAVQSFRATLQSVRERFEHGTRSALDVRLAAANLADAAALRARRRAQHDRSRRQLEVLLGRYPAAALEGADSLQTAPAVIPIGIPSDLVLRRPDLAAAERHLAAAGARVSEARRAFLPRVALTGSAGSTAGAVNQLTDGDFFVWGLFGNLVQPIFQGGRLRAQAQLAHADAAMLLENYAQAVLRAFHEVEDALATESFLADEERAHQESARQAIAAQALAEERYRQGLESFVTVLEAQRGALRARGNLITVRKQRLDARVHLHMALGGSFEVPVGIDGRFDVEPGNVRPNVGGDAR